MLFLKNKIQGLLKQRYFVQVSGLLLTFVMIVFYMNCSNLFPPEDVAQHTDISALSGITDHLSFVKGIKSANLEAFDQACDSWGFIDIVVSSLRQEDDRSLRFGYNCYEGNCDEISTSQVAFYLGDEVNSQSANGSDNVRVFNVIDDPCGSDPNVVWEESQILYPVEQDLVDACTSDCDTELAETDCTADSEEEECEDVVASYNSCVSDCSKSILGRWRASRGSEERAIASIGFDLPPLANSTTEVTPTPSEPVDGECINELTNGCRSPKRATNKREQGPYSRWTCPGSNGGKDATDCKRIKDAVGDCSDRSYSCDKGVSIDKETTQTHYTWKCEGNIRTVPCKTGRDGHCDYSKGTPSNACTAGTFRDTRDSDRHWKWKCIGSGSGDDKDCEQRKVPVAGVCDESRAYACATPGCTGIFSRCHFKFDTSEHYRWRCRGLYGGRNSDVCQKDKDQTTTTTTRRATTTTQRVNTTTTRRSTTTTQRVNTTTTRRSPTTTAQRQCQYVTERACENALPSNHRGACRRNGFCWDSICPSNRQNRNYGVKTNRCLPSCGLLCSQSSFSGTCASGNNACNDTRYNIRNLGTAYDVGRCCKRARKTTTTTRRVTATTRRSTTTTRRSPTTTAQRQCQYVTERACENALPSNHRGACRRNGFCWDSICPSNRQNRNYGVKTNRCLPSCGLLCSQSSFSGTCASGNNACNDTRYNIRNLGTAYDVGRCCKRARKTTTTTRRVTATTRRSTTTTQRRSTTPDPKCGARTGSCADNGNGVGCCRPGHYHNHPPDGSGNQLKWTCRKTANSPAGEIRCP